MIIFKFNNLINLLTVLNEPKAVIECVCMNFKHTNLKISPYLHCLNFVIINEIPVVCFNITLSPV